jgi:hypothetical protein
MIHLASHKIANDAQHCFRKRRSSDTQLILTANDRIQNTENGLQTDLTLLDFSKAIDNVPHEHLVKKLGLYGIRGITSKWIRNFLSDRVQEVIVGGVRSKTENMTSAVPQGSIQ